MTILRFLIVVIIGCWIVPSASCSQKSGNSESFKRYYEKVLNYRTFPSGNIEVKSFPGIEKSKEIVPTLIDLSANDILPFVQELELGNLTISRLEQMFYENLGSEAEQICQHFSNFHSLPPRIETLRQIYHGKLVIIKKDEFPVDFLIVAYRVANQAYNYPMVEELFNLLGVEDLERTIKEENPGAFTPYIHEPYWSYNITQLKQYGHRVLHKLKPLLITQNQLTTENGRTFVQTNHENKVPVREIATGFGRILPNLYLQDKLKANKDLGVPRIFVLPKEPNAPINILFLMPYENYPHTNRLFSYPGENPLQVFCDDFIVYQEVIEGIDVPGNLAFTPYGHQDTNAAQIIKSPSGKKYLIDTKERKNFIAPLPSEVIFELKSLSFDPRMIFVHVKLDPIDK